MCNSFQITTCNFLNHVFSLYVYFIYYRFWVRCVWVFLSVSKYLEWIEYVWIFDLWQSWCTLVRLSVALLFLTNTMVSYPFPIVLNVTVAFLYYQTRSWLIIILLLVLQAGGSDKKASQGHEEKHWGWFRCVTAGCAIDLHLFTNILDVAWQVFQG